MKKNYIFILMLSLLSVSLHAQITEIQYIGEGADSNFTTSANWAGGATPGDNDSIKVSFDSIASLTCEVTADISVLSIWMGEGSSRGNENKLIIRDGVTLTSAGKEAGSTSPDKGNWYFLMAQDTSSALEIETNATFMINHHCYLGKWVGEATVDIHGSLIATGSLGVSRSTLPGGSGIVNIYEGGLLQAQKVWANYIGSGALITLDSAGIFRLTNHAANGAPSKVEIESALSDNRIVAGVGTYLTYVYGPKIIAIYGGPDTDNPEISSTIPVHGSANIAIENDIEIQFSEIMNNASVEGAINITPALSNPVYSWNEWELTISSDDLIPNTTYSVTIGTGAQDANGNAFTKDSTFTFTTDPSHDATLSSFTVNGVSLTPATNMIYNAPFGSTSVIVSAVANDVNAGVTGTGVVDVSSGSGSATVTVTAQDGSTIKTYTVDITVLNSNVATLSDLTVSPGSLTTVFNSATLTYTAEAPYGTTGVIVDAEASDPNAGIAGTGAVDVSSGNGSATIVVTAVDGITKKTYTVDIIVLKSNDATLSEITVSPGYLIRDFNGATSAYYIGEVPPGTTTVTITATANDENAVIAPIQTIDVSSGAGYGTVVVTADDGSTQTYLFAFKAIPSGINTTSINEMGLYPNPATDFVYLEEIAEAVNIYSTNGQLVLFEENVSVINVQELTRGYYIVKITNKEDIAVGKLIIK